MPDSGLGCRRPLEENCLLGYKGRSTASNHPSIYPEGGARCSKRWGFHNMATLLQPGARFALGQGRPSEYAKHTAFVSELDEPPWVWAPPSFCVTVHNRKTDRNSLGRSLRRQGP